MSESPLASTRMLRSVWWQHLESVAAAAVAVVVVAAVVEVASHTAKVHQTVSCDAGDGHDAVEERHDCDHGEQHGQDDARGMVAVVEHQSVHRHQHPSLAMACDHGDEDVVHVHVDDA